jgi:S-formylglutathione hydrolase
METLSTAIAFGGTQTVHTHASEVCGCDMTFAVYMPPQAKDGPVPVLWYLSGLTCSHANVMDKGEYRAHAAKHGVAIVCPDTSPRGDTVPDDDGNWQFGTGAGFYLDATAEPWRKNYNMYSYITQELPELVAENFAVDMKRQGVFGHSMGGHGALTIALKNPETFKSCSAFAPIVQPTTADWSSGAFARYLGDNPELWADYDATLLIENGGRFSEILVDQGDADGFLDDGLRPWLLQEACDKAGIPLTLRMQPGYDHSYFFISTFMEDHIKWHAERL